MPKWTEQSAPPIAQYYKTEKLKAFLQHANFAMEIMEDEPLAILAGMIGAGEEKNAETRARVMNKTELFTQAKELVSRADFAKGHTLDAEIFAVGTWNRTWKFKSADLDDIVKNFETLAPYHKVPLKFGHNEEQKITDGQPALGWVTRVWRTGDKLMARFENVPTLIKQAFEAKLYRHVSVELDIDVEHKGKRYKYVLSAVALLGADRPAVNTLADLSTYLDGGERFAASRREVFSAISGGRNSSQEKDEMTPEEVQAAIDRSLAPMQKQVTDLTAENTTLKAANAAFKAKEESDAKEAKTVKMTAHRKALTDKLEVAVKDKRLTPAQRESAIKFMRINDDAAVMEITAEQVDEYIKVNGGKAKMSTQKQEGGFEGKGDTEAKDYDDAGAEIVRRAQALQAEDSKLSFTAARDKVMQGDPELARAWLGGEEE